MKLRRERDLPIKEQWLRVANKHMDAMLVGVILVMVRRITWDTGQVPQYTCLRDWALPYSRRTTPDLSIRLSSHLSLSAWID